MSIRCISAAILCLCSVYGSAEAGTVLVEAESFADRGGWVIDQQAMDIMGSPFILAHGLGTPVADAKTTVKLPEPGEYRVFVRTRDWVAPFGASGSPGRFQVLVDSKPLTETFGTRSAAWFWQDGGTITVDKDSIQLSLHDLTGFEGRCDAIVLTNEPGFVPPEDLDALRAFRRKALNIPKQPREAGEFDLVVMGGGTAGCCTAISAARLGMSVALIQNRPVLGGNSSSEVRVGISGGIRLKPYPILGEIVEEMKAHGRLRPHNAGAAEGFRDEVKMRLVKDEKNISLFLCEHANEVETDKGQITAVVSTNTTTGKRTHYQGRWFADCTGNGTIGFLAGADFDVTEKGHMGTSNLWRLIDTGKPVSFPTIDWGIDLEGKPYPKKFLELGGWHWESGFDRDTIRDVEKIRDHNMRAMYSVWSRLKNVDKMYPNHSLVWSGYVGGQRESRRLMGDVIMSKEDVIKGRKYPDACVPLSWTIDLHVPNPEFIAASPGNEFISIDRHTRWKPPYAIPYRCLYSRNIDNLFMAGRDISVTHEGLGPARVMATTGMMGEVVGRAAYLCKKHKTNPRGVYKDHWKALQELLHTSTKTLQKLLQTSTTAKRCKSSADRGKSPYRAIFNCDGWGVFIDAKGDLDKWIENVFGPIEDTHVDALFWNDGSGGNTARYDSDVLELAGKRFGKVDPDIAKMLKEGNDPPKIIIREAHKRGLDVFWSHRLNDVHDRHAKYRKTEYPLFKEQNPDWTIGSSTALNFAVPEVRQLKLKVLQEIFDKYDFDGLEIDFMRSPPYFVPNEALKHAHLMTDFIRQLRKRLDEQGRHRGRPIKLAVHVGETVEGNRLLGLEIERWVREQLIDLLIVGSGPIDIEVKKFRELVEGSNVSLYACLYGYPSHYNPSLPNGLTEEMVRGLASNYWHQGADGIYLFNWFVHDQASNHYRHWPHLNSTLQEIGDPRLMAFKPIMFPAENEASFRLSRLSVEISPGHSVEVPVYVGTDVSASNRDHPLRRLELRIVCTRPEDVIAHVNDHGLEQQQRKSEGELAIIILRPEQVRQGFNSIILSNRGNTIIRVRRVEIHADYH